uniref:Uncharacterized protein n=1 Tax=Arundo donax TaxID=35708 RepID=A0A0A9G8A4_ARUDO
MQELLVFLILYMFLLWEWIPLSFFCVLVLAGSMETTPACKFALQICIIFHCSHDMKWLFLVSNSYKLVHIRIALGS